MTPALAVGVFAAAAWIVVLLLPYRPWRTAERLGPASAGASGDLANVTVLIPARNEADRIGATLTALARQGTGLNAIVIDDESVDGTAEAATESASALGPALHVEVIRGAALPDGWGGKLWALQQGFERATTEWLLLLDADIEIDAGVVDALLDRARTTDSDLVSVMADLRCVTGWERLLVPPFIYFFKLLYPFSAVADPASRIAAAAGGCILVRRDALTAAGAFGALRDALIDDCTLARLVKRTGRRLWLGLGHGVRSTRHYASLGDFAAMIARTAFTQLRYSTVLLVLVTVLMLATFWGPFLVIWNHPTAPGVSIGATGFAAMLLGFAPVHRWYRLHWIWLLTLPLAALLYLGMTWRSAIAYWSGTRARWKGRAYAAH